MFNTFTIQMALFDFQNKHTLMSFLCLASGRHGLPLYNPNNIYYSSY